MIPARGGSKRVPRKNLHPLGGRPLIAWSIERALAATRIERTVVSTEDDEIADVSRSLGAEVVDRPVHLAGDDVPDLPVLTHVVEELSRRGIAADAVVHLRPTLPFRTSRQIDEAVGLLDQHADADCVKSVYPTDKHPYKMWVLHDRWLRPYQDTPLWREFGPDYPSQKLGAVLWSAGLVDAIRVRTLLELRSTVGRSVLPYFVPADACVDLDTPQDFRVAEALLAIGRKESPEWAR